MEIAERSGCLTGRPGGFILTSRAAELGSFGMGSRILDIGCGSGETVRYLRSECGIEAFGIDKNLDQSSGESYLIMGHAEDLPFPDGYMDGILTECSFSLFEDQEKSLKECFRILKPDGRLIISDLYALSEPAQLGGCLGKVDSKEFLMSLLHDNGFKVEIFEDQSHHLKTLFGQMIMDEGVSKFLQRLGQSPDIMKRVRCGYYLCSAIKTTEVKA
ncbi:MAG: DVU_1556 family methyltransferase [Bacteroidales bacterium]